MQRWFFSWSRAVFFFLVNLPQSQLSCEKMHLPIYSLMSSSQNFPNPVCWSNRTPHYDIVHLTLPRIFHSCVLNVRQRLDQKMIISVGVRTFGIITRCHFCFFVIDGELTTWPANNCLQISVLLQIIFWSCVIETTLLCENGGSVPRTGREWFDIFMHQSIETPAPRPPGLAGDLTRL